MLLSHPIYQQPIPIDPRSSKYAMQSRLESVSTSRSNHIKSSLLLKIVDIHDHKHAPR